MARRFSPAVFASLIACATITAQAQDWPTKPVRIVVPFAPGGVSDIIARTVAASMSQGLGQPVVVDNKPGSQGFIGVQNAKSSAADGYTLVLMSSSVGCVNPALRKDVPFDISKDFDPVGMVGAAPLVMVVAPDMPVNSVAQFIEYAKASPNQVNYSSPGIGGSAHLYGSVMNARNGLDMQLVPYQGGVPALQAVISGEVQMTFADMGSATGQLQAEKLKALAIAGEKRWPKFPNVPTFAEAGYPINLVGWVGLMTPAGTPQPVIDRLNAELRKFAQAPENHDRLLISGVQPNAGSPADMAHAIQEGCPQWANAIKEAGIKPE
ncbi:MAG: tripartite tricarboxylate transporter substrate binding protein [Porticoccaceae bacterium]